MTSPSDDKEIPHITIPKAKRANPEGFSEVFDYQETSLCDTAFMQNIVWSLCNGIPGHLTDDSPELGT